MRAMKEKVLGNYTNAAKVPESNHSSAAMWAEVCERHRRSSLPDSLPDGSRATAGARAGKTSVPNAAFSRTVSGLRFQGGHLANVLKKACNDNSIHHRKICHNITVV